MKAMAGTKGISRRNFLAGAALAGSAAAFAGMTACSPSNTEATQASGPVASSSTSTADDPWAIEELGEPAETLTCELCVIGGGGTGLAAGIQAAIVIESTITM